MITVPALGDVADADRPRVPYGATSARAGRVDESDTLEAG